MAAVNPPEAVSFKKFRRPTETRSVSALSMFVPPYGSILPFESTLAGTIFGGCFFCPGLLIRLAFENAYGESDRGGEKDQHLHDIAHNGCIPQCADGDIHGEHHNQNECDDVWHFPSSPPIFRTIRVECMSVYRFMQALTPVFTGHK